MTFINLNLLLYIFVVIIIFIASFIFYILFQRKKISFISKNLLPIIYPISFTKIKLKIFIHILIILLLGITILKPGLPTKKEKIETSNLDILIALDISPSMMAKDLLPDRLTRAKREIYSLLNRLQNYQVGLILFSGSAIIPVPLTTDYASIKSIVEVASPEYISNKGTNFSEVIYQALQNFSENKKILILITDGEDHSKQLERAIKEAKDKDIIIYPIGLGSGGGSPVPDYNAKGQFLGYKKDKKGNHIVSKLNSSLLHSIAKETKGQAFIVDQESFNLNQILKAILAIETKKVEQEVHVKGFQDLYQYFLFPALFLLVISMLISNKNYRKELKLK